MIGLDLSMGRQRQSPVQRMRTLFHWTLAERAIAILQEGFKDTNYRQPPGVHLCDRRGSNHSTGNDTLLLISLPEEKVTQARLDPIQLATCCDYIIPAAIINSFGTVRLDESE